MQGYCPDISLVGDVSISDSIQAMDCHINMAVATGYDTFFAQFRDDPSFEAFGGFSVSENAVSAPEPASWVTIILGLGALGGAVRRRRALALA